MPSTHCIPTTHALQRMSQRAIRDQALDIILDYGELHRSGRDWLLVLTDRALAGTPFASLVDRLRGLAAVLTSDGVLKTVQRLYHVRRRAGVLRRDRRAPSG